MHNITRVGSRQGIFYKILIFMVLAGIPGLELLAEEHKPAGRAPPGALLFVQAATKSKQKTPSPAGGMRSRS
jgi:hypothetical protein